MYGWDGAAYPAPGEWPGSRHVYVLETPATESTTSDFYKAPHGKGCERTVLF